MSVKPEMTSLLCQTTSGQTEHNVGLHISFKLIYKRKKDYFPVSFDSNFFFLNVIFSEYGVNFAKQKAVLMSSSTDNSTTPVTDGYLGYSFKQGDCIQTGRN